MLEASPVRPAPTGLSQPEDQPPRRARAALALLCVAGLLVVATLAGLGTWQVHRLRWKLDLIGSVDARINAPPVPPPGPAAWPGVTAEADQYRHVTTHGTFDDRRETFVQAVTDRGPGFWLLVPLRTADGFTVLVNRGFVPPDRRDPATRAVRPGASDATVTGLLRVTEPGGAFLRHNDPAGDHWYSRDVAAITARRGLAGAVAPYFVDADASPNPGGFPIGGLTVVSFPNNHLVYAATWYVLALMLAGALAWMVREEARARSGSPGSSC